MVLLKHELKQGLKGLIIWTCCIAFLVVACILLFPEMKAEMEKVNDMFASMGSFTQAFGMDKVNFGSLKGFYAVECGNILGLGGAFFAALIGIQALAKEEGLGTAEFLLTNPIPRWKIITSKYIASIIKLVVMNLVCFLFTIIAIVIIREDIPWAEFIVLHLAFLFMQIEILSICFGISSFLAKGNMGIGIGISIGFYFLNILANLTDSAKFLKYLTPFGFSDGAEIMNTVSIDMGMLTVGIVLTVIGSITAYYHYIKKDIK